MIVLDTNVISALRKPDSHRQVVAWVEAQHEPDLYLTAITIGELERGAALKKQRAPGAGTALEAWVAATVTSFFDRILPFGREEARIGDGCRQRSAIRVPTPRSRRRCSPKARRWRPETSGTSPLPACLS